MELKLLKLLLQLRFRFFLLIVPYGIETKTLDDDAEGFLLLIVPYGIETTQRRTCYPPSTSF